MRLICPNCDAQYEVPDDVIPTEGRDVQCSNCGQTWFQNHPDHAPEATPAETPDETEERVETAPEADTARKSREIDPSIAEILRQEAEQERKAREADALESQPDLGLDDMSGAPEPERDHAPAPQPEQEAEQEAEQEVETENETARRSREAHARMARMRGEDPDTGPEAAAAAAVSGSRRDLLPDIEEINSTLRSAGDRQAASASGSDADIEPVIKVQQRSFRRGFAVSVLIVVLLVGLYVATPRIIEAVPAAEPALVAYTQQVDAMRLWLDGQVTRLLTWMDSAAGT